MFVSGKTFGLFALLAFWAITYYYYRIGKSGRKIDLRKIPAFDALDEAIGKAAEEGKPALVTTGYVSFERRAGSTIVAMDMVMYTAYKASLLGVPTIVAVGPHDQLPIAMENYRTGTEMAGHPEMFSETNIRYLTGQQWAYTNGVLGILERERPGAAIMVGSFLAESIHFGVTSRRVGAMSIAGTQGLSTSFFITTDYCLIGDEIYATGAWISQEPVRLAGVASTDVFKLLAVISIVLGSILVTFGSDFLIELFKL
jgi:hypothetical protein